MDSSDKKDKTQYLHSDITGKILQCFYRVFNHTGYGFDKGIYTKSLHIEFQKSGTNEKLSQTDELILYNHLKTSVLEVGLLLNFGVTPMQRRKTFSNNDKSNMS